MINNKKKINKIKTEIFLKKFPLLFLLQHNNLTVNDWFDLRQKLKEISEKSSTTNELSLEKSSCIEILNIKNSVFKKSVPTRLLERDFKEESNSLNFILQGPNFLVGCQNPDHLKMIWHCIQSHPKLVFISCLYNNQLVNHLDFEILLKTNSSIYQNLFFQLEKKTELLHTLRPDSILHPGIAIQQNFLMALSFIK